MSIIDKAKHFAFKHHQGQDRKYNGMPYISHPERVARKISTHPFAGDNLIAAAWLHDTIEDCEYVSADTIEQEFGEHIARIVIELTNTSKCLTHLSRSERKELDRCRLEYASQSAKLIKLADRIDNLHDMRLAPEKFAKLYRKESLLLLGVLRGVYKPFEDELQSLVEDSILC